MTDSLFSGLTAAYFRMQTQVRANARMKYLVHTLGIHGFRSLVEEYFGETISPIKPMKEWKFSDWLGWHDQGDGKMFKGFWVSSGRIRDQDGVNVKTALRTLVDEIECDVILTPNQNIVVSNIAPENKGRVDEILAENGIEANEKALTPLHEVIPRHRHSSEYAYCKIEYAVSARGAIACAALPLCGLAITEAERVLPEYIDRVHKLMDTMGLAAAAADF
eukprot:jgi/Bigna1/81800/fgenesh1_pg.84_\